AALGGPGRAAAGLRRGGDRVAEEVLEVVCGRGVQDAAEVAAHQFDVAPAGAVVEQGDVDGDAAASGGVGHGHPAQVGAGAADLRQQAHPVDDLDGGAADVDGVAAVARAGRALEEDGGEAEPVQPGGGGGAGDARPGDEDGAVGGGQVLHLSGVAARTGPAAAPWTARRPG